MKSILGTVTAAFIGALCLYTAATAPLFSVGMALALGAFAGAVLWAAHEMGEEK